MSTVTHPAASAPRDEARLVIQILVDEHSRELGLNRSELVRRCGYKNVSKGIRRLDEL
jgi:hypothetical protein